MAVELFVHFPVASCSNRFHKKSPMPDNRKYPSRLKAGGWIYLAFLGSSCFALLFTSVSEFFLPDFFASVAIAFRAYSLDFFWLNLEADKRYFAFVESTSFDQYYVTILLSVYLNLFVTLLLALFFAWDGRPSLNDPESLVGKPTPITVFLGGASFVLVIWLMEFVMTVEPNATGKSWVLLPLYANGLPFILLDFFYIFFMSFFLLIMLAGMMLILGINAPVFNLFAHGEKQRSDGLDSGDQNGK